MNSIVTMGNALTMSSREIAGLTGKRHDNVMSDCKKLADFYSQSYSPEISGEHVKTSTYKDPTGRELPCFELNKQASLDLVTGYSLPHRHAVNKRWQELEELVQQPSAMQLPQTYSDALRLLADQVEETQRISHQRDEAIRTKAQISSSREASTMGKLSAATKKIAKLEKTVGDNRDWKTAKSITWLPDVFDLTGKRSPAYSQIGKRLTAISNEIGVEIREVEDSAYGKVKAYHLDAINEFHSRINSDPDLLAKYRKNKQENAA